MLGAVSLLGRLTVSSLIAVVPSRVPSWSVSRTVVVFLLIRGAATVLSVKTAPSKRSGEQTIVRDTLGLAVLIDCLLTTSSCAGSDTTSFQLRSTVLEASLVGHMGLTRLDRMEMFLLFVSRVGNGQSCQTKENSFVEDHCDCQRE